MRTQKIRELRFDRAALLPESREWLDHRIQGLDRHDRREASFFGRLKAALTPRDWRPQELADFVQGRVLVVGCGRGLESLALGGVGLDIDLPSLRVAADLSRHLEGGPGAVLAADGARIPFRDAIFDTVLSDNVVEHIPDSILGHHFREVFRVLKPGGRYAFHTPNGIYENPPGRPDHISLHSYAEWERLALDAGFVEPLTPRRRSGPLVSPEWKKDYERGADPRRRPPGTSHKGVRMVTLVVRKP